MHANKRTGYDKTVRNPRPRTLKRKNPSGIECLAARLRWEESKDSVIKEEILDYNRQDCLAVQRVANFLLSLGSPEGTVHSSGSTGIRDQS